MKTFGEGFTTGTLGGGGAGVKVGCLTPKEGKTPGPGVVKKAEKKPLQIYHEIENAMNKALKSTKCKNSIVVGMGRPENELMTRTHIGTFGAGHKNAENDENKAGTPEDQDLGRLEQSHSANNEKCLPTGIKNAGSVKNSIGMTFTKAQLLEDTTITPDPHPRDPSASGLTRPPDFPSNDPKSLTRTFNSDPETSSQPSKPLAPHPQHPNPNSVTHPHSNPPKKPPSKLSNFPKSIYKNNPYYSNLDPPLTHPPLTQLNPTLPSPTPTPNSIYKFSRRKNSIHNENFRLTNPYTSGTTT